MLVQTMFFQNYLCFREVNYEVHLISFKFYLFQNFFFQSLYFFHLISPLNQFNLS